MRLSVAPDHHLETGPRYGSELLLFSHKVVSNYFVIPWTVACQAHLSMRFPRQEYWSGLLFLSPGYLPNPGIEPASPAPPALQPDSLPLSHCGSPHSELVQFSSVAQLCPTLCDPMDCSMPGLPVHHQLLELSQTHVHRVSDDIQPSHPLSSSSPLPFSLSQHQGLF